MPGDLSTEQVRRRYDDMAGNWRLLGIVDSAADRLIAEVRAREVTGVFEVENSLTVVRQEGSTR